VIDSRNDERRSAYAFGFGRVLHFGGICTHTHHDRLAAAAYSGFSKMVEYWRHSLQPIETVNDANDDLIGGQLKTVKLVKSANVRRLGINRSEPQFHRTDFLTKDLARDRRKERSFRNFDDIVRIAFLAKLT
jgi:hypothetical protein